MPRLSRGARTPDVSPPRRCKTASTVEALVIRARAGDVRAMEDLLEQFKPFLTNCRAQPLRFLPPGYLDVVVAEVDFLFLSLLSEFQPLRGIPFPAYVKKMLPQRMRNFVRDEWRYLARNVCLDDLIDEQDESIGPLLSWDKESEEWDTVPVRIWFTEAVKKLLASERRVIKLAVKGFSTREIGMRLRVSRSRVHELKISARRKLLKDWETQN